MKQQLELIKLKEILKKQKLPKVMVLLLMVLMLNVYEGQSQHYKVVLMMGQSNMVGAGSLSDFRTSGAAAGATNHFIWADLANPTSSGYVYRNHPKLRSWQFLNDGAQFGYGASAGEHGCEYGLSNQLKTRYPSANFAFIKIAIGASSLYYDWWSGAPGAPAGAVYTRFKNHFNNVINQAVSSLPSGASIEVVGILWMQGETDSETPQMSNSYNWNLKNFVNKVRALVNSKTGLIHRSQPIPFITGVVTDSESLRIKCNGRGLAVFPPYLWKVRQSQYAAMSSIGRGATIATADLPRTCNDLAIHYNSSGLTEMGIRFANKLATFYPYSKTGDSFQENKKKVLEVLAYPNPVEDVLQITLDQKELQNVSINILDINNQIVKQVNVKKEVDTKNIEIDMEKTPNGVYILQILNNGESIQTSKVIKLNNK